MVRRHTGIMLMTVLALLGAACSSSGSPEAAPSSTTVAAGQAVGSLDQAGDHDPSRALDDEGHDGAMGESEPAEDALTVRVRMVDLAFEPATIEVPAGQALRFVFDNVGMIEHEAMLGDAHMQMEFAEGHRDHGGGHHGDIDAVTVLPAQTGELMVTFDEPQTVFFGCHLPGHYEAGMEATINVT